MTRGGNNGQRSSLSCLYARTSTMHGLGGGRRCFARENGAWLPARKCAWERRPYNPGGKGLCEHGCSNLMAAPTGPAGPPGLLGSVVRIERGWQAVLPSSGSQLVIGVFASRQLATVALDLLRLGSGLSTGLDAKQVPLEYSVEVGGSKNAEERESAAARSHHPSNDDLPWEAHPQAQRVSACAALLELVQRSEPHEGARAPCAPQSPPATSRCRRPAAPLPSASRTT